MTRFLEFCFLGLWSKTSLGCLRIVALLFHRSENAKMCFGSPTKRAPLRRPGVTAIARASLFVNHAWLTNPSFVQKKCRRLPEKQSPTSPIKMPEPATILAVTATIQECSSDEEEEEDEPETSEESDNESWGSDRDVWRHAKLERGAWGSPCARSQLLQRLHHADRLSTTNAARAATSGCARNHPSPEWTLCADVWPAWPKPNVDSLAPPVW